MQSFKLQRNKQRDENATKKCSDCMAEIPLKAKKCQHCGAKQKEKIESKQLLIIMGFLIFVLIVIFSGGDNTSTPPQERGITDSQAFITSQDYVKSVLKSPASADFPLLDYTAYDLGDGKWSIVSYVDSQNSFGVQMRTNWVVTLTHTGGNWTNQSNWELDELIFGDEVVYP